MIQVFDLDGTLLDSNGVWAQVDETFLGRHGLRPTAEYNEYVTHAIFPDAARFTRSYYQIDEPEEEIMAAWHKLAFDAYARHLPLKPGVKEYLDRCAQQGDRLALYSSGEPSLCIAALERHGITQHFEVRSFAQETGLEKRYPASFAALSERLGEPPSECMLFDDSPLACAAAKQAGWQVTGIQDPIFLDQRERMEQICDRYIAGFSELL